MINVPDSVMMKMMTIPPFPVKRLHVETVRRQWPVVLQADTLEGFRRYAAGCCDCTVGHRRFYAPVLPTGPLTAKVAFVGRNPDICDGVAEYPFHPRSPMGQVFAQYLAVLGLRRDEVYVTNTLFCCAAGERDPHPLESEACASRHKALELSLLTRLEVLILMGQDALRTVLDPSLSITGHYGYSFVRVGSPWWGDRPVYVVPVMHPGYLLRNQYFAALLWRHLGLIRDRFLSKRCVEVS